MLGYNSFFDMSFLYSHAIAKRVYGLRAYENEQLSWLKLKNLATLHIYKII